MSAIDEIEREIAEKKKQLAELKEREKFSKRNEAVKSLEEYTIDEKIKFFDDLYASSLSMLDEKEQGELGDEIDTQYDWEANMNILARDTEKFWKYWGSL